MPSKENVTELQRAETEYECQKQKRKRENVDKIKNIDTKPTTEHFFHWSILEAAYHSLS